MGIPTLDDEKMELSLDMYFRQVNEYPSTNIVSSHLSYIKYILYLVAHLNVVLI